MEQTVLASILYQNNLIAQMPDKAEQLFFVKFNMILFQGMQQLNSQGKAIDEMMLFEQVKHEEVFTSMSFQMFLKQVVEFSPMLANFQGYVLELAKLAQRRFVVQESVRMMECAENGETYTPQQNDTYDVPEYPTPLYDVVDKNLNIIEQKMLGNAKPLLKTGFRKLDELILGIDHSDFVIIAARPSMGKTAFATSLALRAAKENRQVLLFSIEMNQESIANRVLSTESQVDGAIIRDGNFLSEQGMDKLVRSHAQFKGLPFYIDNNRGKNVTPAYLRQKMQLQTQRLGKSPDIVLIDYLQLMHPGMKCHNTEDEVRQISRQLKLLAGEFDCPIIALSQLNRSLENRGSKTPQSSDLRYSGALEQDADMIILIHRKIVYDKDYKHPEWADFKVAKHRNGAVGTVVLGFNEKTTEFYDI